MKNTKLNNKISILNAQLVLEKNDIDSVVTKIQKIHRECPRKFVESVDVSIGLNLNKKDNISIRGSCYLPHGHGKNKKIIVFAEGQMAVRARELGADLVGGAELISDIQNQRVVLKDFDACLAMESTMKLVIPIAQILSGRKLMPNKKDGTILGDNEDALKDAVKGVQNNILFKNNRYGYVRVSVGKVNFPHRELVNNISTLLHTIRSFNKSTKNIVFFKNIHVSTTMGPSVPIDISMW